jgi:NAD(P)-dependent dehydrogenase (short-subunit alcohol dehydrogenase family)
LREFADGIGGATLRQIACEANLRDISVHTLAFPGGQDLFVTKAIALFCKAIRTAAHKTGRSKLSSKRRTWINSRRPWRACLASIRRRRVCSSVGISQPAKGAACPQFLEDARAECVPLERVEKPEDIATVIVFLASVGAGYINSQSILAEGSISATGLN